MGCGNETYDKQKYIYLIRVGMRVRCPNESNKYKTMGMLTVN